MRRTFPGAPALPVALTTAVGAATVVAAGLVLGACAVGDDAASGKGSSSSSGGSSTTQASDVATLGLSVGDCLADLGSAESAEPSEVSPSSSTTATSTTSGSASRTASTTPSTTSSRSATSTAEPTESRDAVLDDTVPDRASGVTTVSCDDPHVGEVYEQHDLDNEVLFPGQRMSQFTAAVCTGDSFTDYTGTLFDYSPLDVVSYAPSKESWAAGDRTVTCVVTDPENGPVTGTLRQQES